MVYFVRLNEGLLGNNARKIALVDRLLKILLVVQLARRLDAPNYSPEVGIIVRKTNRA